MSNEFNIKNIAKLASINLSEEEQDSLSNDLSIILEHVNALSDLKLNSQQQEKLPTPSTIPTAAPTKTPLATTNFTGSTPICTLFFLGPMQHSGNNPPSGHH